MFIEIKGIGIPNKGAELMLISIKEAILNADAKYAVEPSTDYLARARFGLYQTTHAVVRGFDLSWLISLIPSKLLQKFGVVRDRDLQVIIDASGFAYGDYWGIAKAKRRLMRPMAKFKRDGKLVVLLPQAFGPFTDSRMRSGMMRIVSQADLIYARDSVSLQHLNSILPGKAKKAPDFTNLVKGYVPDGFKSRSLDVCFIPNQKVIESAKQSSDSGYIDIFAQAMRVCIDLGKKPVLMVHEGKSDRTLAEKITRKLGGNIEIIEEESPLALKGIISRCELVVSSRFHGLVSSLSQGVPAIGLGWSHKYHELFSDYGVREYSLTLEKQCLSDSLRNILTSSLEYSRVKALVLEHAQIERQKSLAMWKEVNAAIALAAGTVK